MDCVISFLVSVAVLPALVAIYSYIVFIVYVHVFRIESLSDTYEYSECSGKPSYNVSSDMPGQIRYMKWLILIMPLSTSVLNCAINLGREGPGSCFTTTGVLSITLWHQYG